MPVSYTFGADAVDLLRIYVQCLVVRYYSTFGEEIVDGLQLKTFCLGEEHVDDGQKCSVEDGEDDICTPAYVRDRRRRDLDDRIVDDPI